jgi:NADH-quinone oxidoreductase subunit L
METVTPVAATGLYAYAWLLIAIPALSATFLLLSGKVSDSWGHFLGALAPIVSFVLGLVLFIDLLGRPEEQRSVAVQLYSFIPTGGWDVNVGLQVDQLSILFTLLITGVGSLIHIYSIGYMASSPT